jgi:hypothetical protein
MVLTRVLPTGGVPSTIGVAARESPTKEPRMTTVYVDPSMPDDRRRDVLYGGDLVVYSPRPAAVALADLARTLLEEAFAPHDPREAQYHFPVDRFAGILADVKPRFIHHPECKRLIPELLAQLGADPEQTYFDVPRLRSATAQDYLTTGIAYAFHPHRDTWYSAPQCQLNWWFPVYEIEPDNGMAFHPRYFGTAVRNSSADYNYYRWNAESRGQAAAHIGTDTRVQPRPEEEIELEPQIRLVVPVGGVLVFSAAQLHSTVPNTTDVTRFSIDFRTVQIGDVAERRGAQNVDSACTGTTMRDYLRATDMARVPDGLVAMYDDGTEETEGGELVYAPE